MAIGVNSKPVTPTGPERHSKRYRARPTTTGGRPRNALVKITRGWRPGNEHTANAAPSDVPARVAREVAVRLTPRERPTICQNPSVSNTAQNPEAGTDQQSPAALQRMVSKIVGNGRDVQHRQHPPSNPGRMVCQSRFTGMAKASILLATADPFTFGVEEAAAIVPIRSAGSTRRRASAPVRIVVVRHRPAADCGRRKRRRRVRRSPSMPAPARGAVPPNVHGSWQNRRQREVWSRSLLNASSSFDAARAVMGWAADELACLTLAHRRASKQGEITAPKRSDRMPRRSNGQLPPRQSAGG